MRLACLALFAIGLLSAQSASISGTVVNPKSGEPISGVHIRMLTGNFISATEMYGALSDKAGHYSVANLKPGLYLILVDKPGFVQIVRTEPGIPFQSLTLKAGQHVEDLKLEMNARALLAGRVVNEFGDPVQNVSITLEVPPPGSQVQSPFVNANTSTDDRGEFHLIAGPGKYYLRANLQNQQQRLEVRTDGTTPTTYRATYYPGAPDKGGATLIDAGAGQDLTGLEIRLTTAVAGRGPSISGVVTGAPDNGRASVMLRWGDKPDQYTNGRGASAGPDGKFSFTGLEPGYYHLSAQFNSGKAALVSAPVDVHLTGGDETVQLALAPGEDVSGTLALAGDGPPAASVKRTVHLEPADPFSYMGSNLTPADVEKDGAFHIAGVPPGRFKVTVEPMPENAYLQSVAVDGEPAPDQVLDFSRGARGSHIKVTIDRAGAEISGKILDQDGQPEASPLVMVLMSPDPKHMLHDPAGADRAGEGKYDFKGNRPGKYRIVAIDMLHLISSNGGSPSQETMDKLFEMADEIELKAGDRVVKNLKVIEQTPGKEVAHAPKN